jgi:tetraprenyl-beta-curcumene synthase
MATFNLTKKIDKSRMILQKPFSQWFLIARLVGVVLPAVEHELRGWKNYLKTCPPSFLREQALQSIKGKRFHCQGGAAYALLNHASSRRELLSFITAFQTISDYLDNLCDRLPICDLKLDTRNMAAVTKEDARREQGFRRLHGALYCALGTEGFSAETEDYYRYYPYKGDEGYLHQLVWKCRKSIIRLPNQALVHDKNCFLTGLYSDLQTLKHLSLQRREQALKDWFKPYQQQFFYLYWYEFAAAAGSTLGVFALLASVSRSSMSKDEINALFNLYFPWICGLHILLDYYIDQAEDKLTGDLNFVSYYADNGHCAERIRFFIEQAMHRARGLPHAFFHRNIIKGLLALYLSDPKIREQGLEAEAQSLLRATGERDTFTLFYICFLLRLGGWL